ncbi:MAG TPA: YajQ family cyclic di-GMP-binding protein [Chthonomonadales bacterium]|nr:YajQ family cyclic di-GMP-binding protein [Chthonomonadales bacterium]
MAAEHSFDVVARVDLAEVKNAIDQAVKEVAGRFDFRNSKSALQLEGDIITVLSDDEFRLRALVEILQSKLARRSVSLKALEYGKIESAQGGTVRQKITLRQGIPSEEAKALVRLVKGSGIKVTTQIQGDAVRVSGKEKDALQSAQRLVRDQKDLPYDPEFTNYR